jgi:hypothetical protein
MRVLGSKPTKRVKATDAAKIAVEFHGIRTSGISLKDAVAELLSNCCSLKHTECFLATQIELLPVGTQIGGRLVVDQNMKMWRGSNTLMMPRGIPLR